MVLELAPYGELFDFISETGAFSEPVARYLMYKLLLALQHLHSKGYCNRDLKPENVFFGDNFTLKLADIGYSAFLHGKDGSGKLNSIVGT